MGSVDEAVTNPIRGSAPPFRAAAEGCLPEADARAVATATGFA